MSTVPDRMLKVVLYGDQTVGKSTLGQRIAGQHLEERYIPTIGVDILRVKYISKKGLLYYLQLWDTAGDPRFRSISSSFARGGFAQIYLFDKSNISSFQSIPDWMSLNNANQCQLRILYGNRGKGKGEVTYEEAASVANQWGMVYVEQSALKTEQERLVLELIAGVNEHF